MAHPPVPMAVDVIDPGMSAVSAARMILQGRQTPVRLTFNNIRLMSQLAARVGRVMEADSAGFMAALTEELSDAYSNGISCGICPRYI